MTPTDQRLSFYSLPSVSLLLCRWEVGIDRINTYPLENLQRVETPENGTWKPQKEAGSSPGPSIFQGLSLC